MPSAADLFIWLAPLVIAPIIGSFLGTLILRLPREEAIARGRSHCERCEATLAPRDLVPIVSFLALRGRCRFCRAPIAWLHLQVELAALAVPLMVFAAAPDADAADAWASCGLGWTLLALSWIDLRVMRLPDVLTLPLLLAGLAQAWPDRAALMDRAAGAAAGYVAFAGLAWVYERLRGRAGLGGGDAKLLAAGGAWLGVALLPRIVLLGACTTIVAVLALMARDRRMTASTAVPFGPGLALAIWLLWLWQL